MLSKYPGKLIHEFSKIIKERNLSALFQPIISLDHQNIYGYEGLIRGPSNSILHSPEKLFEVAENCGRLLELDMLCQQLLIRQFLQLRLEGKLFLNVNPISLLEQDEITKTTMKLLEGSDMNTEDIVIEVTEMQPIDDFSLIQNTVNYYRNQGFSVAIDDLGSGYAGLKLWSDMSPDFVKIDRHFINAISEDNIKRKFVRSIFDIAYSVGCNVIAEGVETLEEYATVRKLGAEYVQGFYFSRPKALPDISIKAQKFRVNQRMEHYDGKNQPKAKGLLQQIPQISPDLTLSQTADIFMAAPTAQSIAIVENDKPLGIMTRIKMMEIFGSRFGRSLYERESIDRFMNINIIIAESDIPLETLSQRITGSLDTYIDEFLITEGGKFVGKGTLVDLLKKITDLRVEIARYANPLTMLPGNVPIQKTILEYLEEKIFFVAVYCDLDNFKPFNDYYGYSKGDEVLKILSKILYGFISDNDGFIGHIGGDDFILLVKNKDWLKICKKILSKFAKKARELYSKADRKQGYILALDRFGKQQKFPLMSLSMGAVIIDSNLDISKDAIADLASKAKSDAKKITGNGISYTQAGNKKEAVFKRLEANNF